MTAPSFANWLWVLKGWVFSRRHTLTAMLVAAGAVGQKHHSAFHRLFASSRWSLDELGLAVFTLLLPWVGPGNVTLTLDDTLARKRGLKVFGVGMHHDPLLSSRKTAVVNWGHSWVLLCVVVRLPFCPNRVLSLPILFRLYLNHQAARRARLVHRSRPQLAVQLLELLCKRFPRKTFHALCDSTFGGQSVLKFLPANCHLTSRLVMTARLFDPAPPRRPGQPGRPRRRGTRLATPQKMLEQRAGRLTLNLYGRKDRVRLVEAVACCYSVPDRLLKVVAVEPLSGGRRAQAFYCTLAETEGEKVLRQYAERWSVEEAIQASKSQLGFEKPQGWSRRAVERTAPMAMLLYTLIVVWFARVGHRLYRPLHRPWYRQKVQPSFADMLLTLRRESLREQFLSPQPAGQDSRNLLEALESSLLAAA
jgi:hypothetical protein